VLDSIYQFGGTQGKFLGELEDADEFAEDASEGASDPNTGNLVVIDETLEVVRVFDLQTGEIVGAFGESDRFANNPAALAFHPGDGRLYIAEQTGRVLIFDDESGLLVGEFVNVGPGPVAMRFTPDGESLLVVYGNPGTGVREFDEDGNALGVLGDTATAVTEGRRRLRRVQRRARRPARRRIADRDRGQSVVRVH
jgi:DNA-binding beta-propeller fold protein YncE